MLRSRTSLVAAVLGSALVFSSLALADQILEIYSASLTTYKATGKTPVQGAQPRPEQRGVGLDGTLRAAPSHPMSLAANPFELAAVGGRMLADLDLVVGTYSPTDVDMALPAPGFRWATSRSYGSRQDDGGQFISNGPMGHGWFVGSQPELQLYDDATDAANDLIYLVYGADRYVEFQRKNSTSADFKGKNGVSGAIKTVVYASTEPDTFVYIDGVGNEFEFFDFGTDSGVAKGQLWRITDPAGNVAYVGDATTGSTAITNGFDAGGRITKAFDTAGRRLTHTYSASTIGGAYRLDSVVAETKSGGTWASPTGLLEVGRVAYGYYTSDGDTNGDAGDLRLVTITTPLSDSGITEVRKKHYRYWDGTFDPGNNNPGHPHEVRLVLDFEGARNFDWSQAGTPALDDGFLTAAIDDLKPYATAYFEYNSSGQVNSATFNGQCGCSGGSGSGVHTIAYRSVPGTYTSGYDSFAASRAVVGRPDGSYLTQYFDEVGQPLSQVVTDVAPTSTSPVPIKWATAVVRDARGGVETIGTPASLSSYTHDSGASASGAITLQSAAGLVWKFVRTTSGDFTGFSTARQYSKGTGGTLYYLNSQVLESKSKSLTDVTILRPLIDKQRSFAGLQTTETAYDETDFAYTAWSGAPLTVEEVTVTPPIVSTAKNGSNSSTGTLSYSHHRKDGLADFSKDPDGIITYREYTWGQLTKQIEDADTGLTGSGQDFFGITVPGTFASSGTELHRKTTHTFDAQGRPLLTTLPSGRVTRQHFSRLADGRLVSLGYPRYVSGTGTNYGPVSVRVSNHAGKSVEEGIATVTSAGLTSALSAHISESSSESIAALASLGALTGIHAEITDKTGTRVDESRSYFLMPSALPGTAGTHHDATKFAYDSMGQRVRTVAPDGTISRTDFDLRGRPVATWIGTNDTGAVGSTSSGTSNMVKQEALAYDDVSTTGGNGNLATRWIYVENGSSNRRDTAYSYDVRGNLLLTDNPAGPDSLNKFDNQGRVLATGLFSSTSSTNDPTTTATNRLALSETAYDERGRVYLTTRHKIDVADGSDDDTLTANTWYDAEGRVIKVQGEQLTKSEYDRLGREFTSYELASTDDTAYANASGVSGDVVLEQSVTGYDTQGLVLLQAHISRYHTDLATPTGALDTATTSPLAFTLTGTPDVLGRIQISAMWYDAWDRLQDRVEYGLPSGSSFNRSGLSVPTRSDTELRTSYGYDTAGRTQDVTDPKALVARTEFDAAGRRTRAIANYVDGTAGGGTGDQEDQVVAYAYASGHMTTLTADLPTGQTDQVTSYFQGTTEGTPAAMELTAKGLTRGVRYPDSTNGATDIDDVEFDSSDMVSFAYNTQGQQVLKVDQAGNEIVTVYDDAGREIKRIVNAVASGFDTSVRRIETAYTALGQVETVTQYDATSGGDELDQVKYLYDGWGNVTNFRQDMDDTVDASGYYEVAYAYAKATGGRNTIRRTSQTLGGKTFDFQYRTSGGVQDGNASRVTTIQDSGTGLTAYSYLGAGQVVGTVYDEPDVWSKQYGSTAGVYPDLDRFGRVTTSRWTKDLATDVDFYNVALTYDRNSNILSADDSVHAGFDVAYTMDNLNRLTIAEEGTLSGGSIASPPTRKQEWTLTQTGNWTEDKLDLNGDGDWGDANEWKDAKTFNAVNEIGTRDLDSTPGTTGNNHALVYDPAGNLTSDPSSDVKYEWDSFNRLRKVKKQDGTLVAEYRYNALGYRIGVLEDTDLDSDVDGSDLWYYAAYDERWRMVATYRASDAIDYPKERFVHHQAGDGGFGGSSYIDLVAFREKDANTAWTSASDGTLEERLYYCQNQHADVVSLITAAGTQREMARYSAYGVPFGLPVGDCDSDGDCGIGERSLVQAWITASAYDVRGDIDLDGDVDSTDKDAVRDDWEGVTLGRGVLSAGAVGNRWGAAGYRLARNFTPITYDVRRRWMDASVANWISRDPLQYSDSTSLYQVTVGNPLAFVDPSGLRVVWPSSMDGCIAALISTPLGFALFEGLDSKPEIVEIKEQSPIIIPVLGGAAGLRVAGLTTPTTTAPPDEGLQDEDLVRAQNSDRLSGGSIISYDGDYAEWKCLPCFQVLYHELLHARDIYDHKGMIATQFKVSWYHEGPAKEALIQQLTQAFMSQYRGEIVGLVRPAWATLYVPGMGPGHQ